MSERGGKCIIYPIIKVVMKEGPSSHQQMEALHVARACATSSRPEHFATVIILCIVVI